MNNDAIISMINDVIELEEDIIPTLADFYSKEIEWEGLPKEKAGRLKEILKTLTDDAKKHKVMLATLKGKLEAGG